MNLGITNDLPAVSQPPVVYSYVIEIADSEYQLRLHSSALVSERFAFYHFQKNAPMSIRTSLVLFNLYLMTHVLIFLICNFAPPMEFFKVFVRAREASEYLCMKNNLINKIRYCDCHSYYKKCKYFQN